MTRRIKIISEKIGEVEAELLEEKNPQTANAIWNALPIEARAYTWGDEIYFSIPVKLDEENAQEVVELGDIGYWPPGRGFCIFFGPTPISKKGEIRPADPVNVFARVKGDPKIFKKVKSGDKIRIEKA
ncbi:MAG: cyclophilin-like fold protein [Nitrososphaerota archaeon]|nr:cyclophilin-like fold protein [Candidatus Bathyarchaeota archaeon]MDW8048377.1 cyclophilin-like fold protein [Nitrososphaerota archaeon]